MGCMLVLVWAADKNDDEDTDGGERGQMWCGTWQRKMSLQLALVL
jgi:hypothetical protein